jgi:hypothetical protein
MSILKRLVKSFQILWRELLLLPLKISRWLTRRFFRSSRRNPTQGGFILPTVVMVILVVTLLTTTIVFRSFDRAKNASNVRVNQVTLNAALPAIERAKKKIDALFSDPTLPQGTPTDTSILNAFDNTNYDLGDEVRLRVAVDIPQANTPSNADGNVDTTTGYGGGGITPIQNNEVMTTAWRFPVDTDNNGLFDSFTLYGIYFRSPPSGSNERARSPLEARTPPQDDSATSDVCAAAVGTSASLTGTEGWFKVSGTLKKAFYVYTTTVPITQNPVPANILPDTGDYTAANLYETYIGNRGFSAIEYQQDRTRIPLGNNAIVYEDDLDISTGGTAFRLNGRIIANSNLVLGRDSGEERFYQVSSDESCFYEAENGKVFVGGNVVNGRIGDAPGGANYTGNINLDLYQEGVDPISAGINNGGEESVNNDPNEVGYNTQAYEERIALLVREALTNVGVDPKTVQEDMASGSTREEAFQKWFRLRTRRVPFSEVPFGEPGTGGLTNVLLERNTDRLRPIDNWHYPINPNNGTASLIPGLNLNTNRLTANDPEGSDASEANIGDRVLVGNNLPEKWFDPTTNDFATDESKQFINGETWNDGGARYRLARTDTLDDLGDISRDGFWEGAAAQLPENDLEGYGGLRIVTGAGIYLPLKADEGTVTRLNDLNNPNDDTISRVVWPDTMPVIPYLANHLDTTDVNSYLNIAPWLGEDSDNPTGTSPNNPDVLNDENGNPRPFLRMRASAIYHYTYDNDNYDETTPAPPIACISSFYDPTDSTTARNRGGLPAFGPLSTARDLDSSGDLAWQTEAPIPGFPANPPNIDTTRTNPITGVAYDPRDSNNGITYAPPQDINTGLANNEWLRYQAELVYPNGRLVNPQLARALVNLAGGINNLSLSDRGAIDSALCALQIFNQDNNIATDIPGFTPINPTTTPRPGYTIPHGTIQEVTFLDPREVKAIEGDADTCGSTPDAGNCATTFANNNYDNQPIRYGRSSDIPDLNTPNVANCGTTGDCISQYDLAIELREPLEIRATAIDLDVLRRQEVTNTYENGPQTEWLFPDSGVIYATRDDGLPDASDRPANPAFNGDGSNSTDTALYQQELDKFERVSATDFWLDPTRRPNGILLINGSSLGRGKPPQNTFEEEEKGMILVSNEPVYIKGGPDENGQRGFNLHTPGASGSNQEFDTALTLPDWGNFYTRSSLNNGLNDDFACRTGDDRLPSTSCQTGDQWRQATILSDTLGLLTNSFRFGFRNEGDFDLRNNQTDNLFRNLTATTTLNPQPANFNIPIKPSSDIDKARRDNGFFDNSFSINGLSSGNTTTAFGFSGGTSYIDTNYRNANEIALGSSYFNNGVTPVQRRRNSGASDEYVMEVCRKLPVANCQPGDWVIGYDANLNGVLSDTVNEATLGFDVNGDGDATDNDLLETEVNSEQLWRIIQNGVLVNNTRIIAGTTLRSPLQAIDQHYPRRVAFLRTHGNLVLDSLVSQPRPTPLGINNQDNADAFPYATFNTTGGTQLSRPIRQGRANMLWFRGTNDVNNPWTSPIYNNNNAPLYYVLYNEPSEPYWTQYLDERDDWVLPDIDFFIDGTVPDQEDIANNLNHPAYRTNYLSGTLDTLVNATPNGFADYSICINGTGGGQNANNLAQSLNPTNISGGGCNVDTAVNGFLNMGVYVISDTLNADGTTGSGLVLGDATRPHKTFTDETVTDGDPGRVVQVFAYDLAPSTVTSVNVDDGSGAATPINFNHLGNSASSINLTLEGNAETMFVFRLNTVNPVLIENVNMVLKGVNPNNIFWIVEQGGIVFAGDNSLAGNFLGRNAGTNPIMFDTAGIIRLTGVATNTTIDGGRFLGFTGTGGAIGASAPFAIFNTAAGTALTFNAVTTPHQPILIPALQIQVPRNNNQDPATRNRTNTRNELEDSNWIQRATINNEDNRTFNLALATGDTPSRIRNINPQIIEFNGSFLNFPHLMEFWQGLNLNIQGSFIQLKRSAYGTGPYWQLLSLGNANANNNGSLFGAGQIYSLNDFANNSYFAPGRNWGFDVGILSQLPDLFSQRFTLPPTDDPNEYYREVSRDDDWVQALLCAGFSNTQTQATFGRPLNGKQAVDAGYRPDNCLIANP